MSLLSDKEDWGSLVSGAGLGDLGESLSDLADPDVEALANVADDAKVCSWSGSAGG